MARLYEVIGVFEHDQDLFHRTRRGHFSVIFH